MPQRFVLDASLLKKYSVDRQISSTDYISFDEVYIQLVNQNMYKNIFKELKCLMDLLSEVKENHAVICHNQEIIDQYREFINNIPTEIKEFILAILCDDNCSMRISTIGLTGEEHDQIQNTELRHKESYINVAKTLTKRVIVSTFEDKHNIYDKPPNFEILLFNHQISCSCTCEHLIYLISLES